MVVDAIYGRMAGFIKVTGKIIKWMVMGNSNGLTVGNIKEIMLKIKSRGTGNLTGQKVENIEDNGLMENR